MTVRPDVAAQLSTVDTTTQAFKDFATNVEPILDQELRVLDLPLGRAVGLLPHLPGRRLERRLEVQLPRGAGVRRQSAGDVADPAQAAGAVGAAASRTPAACSSRQERQRLEAAARLGDRGRARAGRRRTLSDGEKFFDDYVMPIFLKRGCALEACHSPGRGQRLQAALGHAGLPLARSRCTSNYDAARRDFLVPDVPDVRQSRLVKKPVRRRSPRAASASCIAAARRCSRRARCSIRRCARSRSPPTARDAVLHHRRVAPRRARGAPRRRPGRRDDVRLDAAASSPWRGRPTTIARSTSTPIRAGADLVDSARSPLGAARRASTPRGDGDAAACSTTARASPPIAATSTCAIPPSPTTRRKVAFAMRARSPPTRSTSTRSRSTPRTPAPSHRRQRHVGERHPLHNLDPMYAPDGTLVFASTRGRPSVGPTLLAQVSPAADRPVAHARHGGDGYGAPEQMTSLLGSELAPADDARTARSRSPPRRRARTSISSRGRRMNWDLTDYHPLLAQRAVARRRSVHAELAMHAVDRLRAGDRHPRRASIATSSLILSDVGAQGRRRHARAPSTARSGPFEADRSDVQFLKSLTILDPAATGRAGATQGAYRSPFPLPDGRDPRLATTPPSPISRRRRRATISSSLDPQTGTRTPIARLRRRRRRRSKRCSSTSASRARCSTTSRSSCSAATSTRRPDARRASTIPTCRCWARCSSPTCARAASSTCCARRLAARHLRRSGAADRRGDGAWRAAPASQMVYQNRKELGRVPLAERRLGARAAAVADAAHPRAAGRQRQQALSP